mmetsp:Transcript_16283/g.53209  ORF Transcript_16283/g.53209 Transcript_16283/m.53209 type:complete len:316 (-) Transcript_16283:3952-4899(-)
MGVTVPLAVLLSPLASLVRADTRDFSCACPMGATYRGSSYQWNPTMDPFGTCGKAFADGFSEVNRDILPPLAVDESTLDSMTCTELMVAAPGPKCSHSDSGRKAYCGEFTAQGEETCESDATEFSETYPCNWYWDMGIAGNVCGPGHRQECTSISDETACGQETFKAILSASSPRALTDREVIRLFKQTLLRSAGSGNDTDAILPSAFAYVAKKQGLDASPPTVVKLLCATWEAAREELQGLAQHVKKLGDKMKLMAKFAQLDEWVAQGADNPAGVDHARAVQVFRELQLMCLAAKPPTPEPGPETASYEDSANA